MIKKGFTLQEALITLVTIGIIAAIAVPRLARIAPDQNHTKYLKAYAQLTSLTNEMLVDPALYFCNDSNGLDCTNMPNPDAIPVTLFNKLNGVANNGNLTAIDKYVQILAYKMNLQTDIYPANGAQVFRTKDGIAWIFDQQSDINNNTIIAVDIDMDGISRQASDDIAIQNGNAAPDRMPDRFMFNIAMDGTVTAADPMGQFYLDNSTNLHQKSVDKLNIAIDKYEQQQNKYRQSINVSNACGGPIMICRPSN